MVVIGIKHLYDGLCQVLLLHCLLIIAPVKGIQVKGIDRLCIPDTQGIYHVIAIADHRQVVGHGTDALITVLYKMVCAVSVFNTHIAAEFYLHSILRAADLKWIAIL